MTIEKIQKKKNKPRKLTRREQLFWKYMTENPGCTITEAGRQAGYAEGTLVCSIYDTVAKGRAKMDAIFEAQGFGDKKLVERVLEGLEAVKSLGNGDQVADYSIRLRYIELISKLKGLLVERTESKSVSIQAHTTIPPQAVERFVDSIGLD